MNPTIDDRLASMIRAMEEVVLPALAGHDGLAGEQAYLVVAHMKQIKSQLPLAGQYERAELVALIKLAGGITDAVTGGPVTTTAARALQEQASAPIASVAGMQVAIDAISLRLSELVRAANRDGSASFRSQLSRSIIAAGARAAWRDRAWFAATGFETGNVCLPDLERAVAD